MKIDKISSTRFGAGVVIKDSMNKHKPLLYNEIQAITKEFKIPAIFSIPKEVKLPTVTKEILEKLKTLKIDYKEIQ